MLELHTVNKQRQVASTATDASIGTNAFEAALYSCNSFPNQLPAQTLREPALVLIVGSLATFVVPIAFIVITVFEFGIYNYGRTQTFLPEQNTSPANFRYMDIQCLSNKGCYIAPWTASIIADGCPIHAARISYGEVYSAPVCWTGDDNLGTLIVMGLNPDISEPPYRTQTLAYRPQSSNDQFDALTGFTIGRQNVQVFKWTEFVDNTDGRVSVAWELAGGGIPIPDVIANSSFCTYNLNLTSPGDQCTGWVLKAASLVLGVQTNRQQPLWSTCAEIGGFMGLVFSVLRIVVYVTRAFVNTCCGRCIERICCRCYPGCVDSPCVVEVSDCVNVDKISKRCNVCGAV